MSNETTSVAVAMPVTGLEFQQQLSKQPVKGQVKSQNLGGKDVKYLPIGEIEKLLDETYFGLWQITNLHHHLTLNAIVVELELEVFHPVGKVWIKRAGIGAIKVQLNRDANSMDVTQIKADALQKGAPAAKAMALKNAAQSLGVRFGRDLNRDTSDDYIYMNEQLATYQDDAIEALRLLDASTMPEPQRVQIRKQIETANTRTLQSIIVWLKGKGGQK